MKINDLTGRVSGRLTVVSKAPSSPKGHAQWNCECECGGTKVVRADRIRQERTKSCGCLARGSRRRQGQPPLNELGEPTSVVSTIAPDNVYGRLTVICAVDPDVAAYKREWLCRCRCKNYKLVRGDRLAYKKTRSCGCRAVDAAKQQLRLWQKRLDIALDRLKEQEAKQEKLEALLATL